MIRTKLLGSLNFEEASPIKNILIVPIVAIALCTSLVFARAAEPVGTKRIINNFLPGSVTKDEGLRYWRKFHEVASHPRCSNCHVGPDNIPMWSGSSYGETRPHGMKINAGKSRIGAETLLCAACHTSLKKPNPAANAPLHSPPKVTGIWGLAPVSAAWFGMSSNHICNQIKDPQRNGNRSIRDVAAHLGHDAVLRWAWSPGGNREPPPRTLQEAMDNLMKWAAAGAPCPGE